ncbi:MAG: hypothetical protein ACOX7N_00730 [Lawsonibacter sp.]|jgi:hypothetical protein
MNDYTGCLVRAEAGRDKGGVFCVVGMTEGQLLLADGRRRKILHPKRKKRKHVTPLEHKGFDHPAMGKLKQGEPVSDRELRRALAAFKEGITLG